MNNLRRFFGLVCCICLFWALSACSDIDRPSGNQPPDGDFGQDAGDTGDGGNGDSGNGDSGNGDSGNGDSGDYLPTPDCPVIEGWTLTAAQMEQEVLELVNDLRDQGVTCTGTETEMPAVDPLEMNSELQCAARGHSFDMFDRVFFAHENPDGESAADRAYAAGYDGTFRGENIAFNYRSAGAVVNAWLGSSSGHCENMLKGGHRFIGVGYHERYWTQKFGR